MANDLRTGRKFALISAIMRATSSAVLDGFLCSVAQMNQNGPRRGGFLTVMVLIPFLPASMREHRSREALMGRDTLEQSTLASWANGHEKQRGLCCENSCQAPSWITLAKKVTLSASTHNSYMKNRNKHESRNKQQQTKLGVQYTAKS